MNIISFPGWPEASTAEITDMGLYIYRGTKITMASHKIVYLSPETDDKDVVAFRGLSAYYRKCTALDMNQCQIKNLVAATELGDAVTLLQTRNELANATESIGALSLIHIQTVFALPANPGDAVKLLQVRAALVLKKRDSPS